MLEDQWVLNLHMLRLFLAELGHGAAAATW